MEMKLRKYLSADALFSLVRSGFEKIQDNRQLLKDSVNKIKITLADVLMSGFAIFWASRKEITLFYLSMLTRLPKKVWSTTLNIRIRMRQILPIGFALLIKSR